MHRKVLQNAHFKNKFALQTDYEIGQSDRFETAPPNQKRGWNEMNILNNTEINRLLCRFGQPYLCHIPISGADFPDWVNLLMQKRSKQVIFTSNIRKMNSETEIWIVLSGLCLMVGLLSKDRLRPGLVLFSVVVLFMCTGILTPEEVLAGFGNKGVITVALLFLVSEGVRRSDALGHLVGRLLPEKRSMNVRQGYVRILPAIASVSAFLNNTPVVVVFIPIIKQWARRTGLPLRKFLIPLSYAAILGGMCTLIGTSTNLVIQGMMLEAGFEGFTMFELGKVGVFIVLAGTLYMIFFAAKRLPGESFSNGEEYPARKEESRIVEAVLGPPVSRHQPHIPGVRFPHPLRSRDS